MILRASRARAIVGADMNSISPRADAALHALFLLGCLVTLAPIWLIIAASISNEQELIARGYGVWPRGFSLNAYSYLFSKGSMIGTAYRNTAVATLSGTVLSVLSVGLYAYPLSRPDFRYRNFFTFVSFFTMLFNGGIVSYYVVCRHILGIGNSLTALFLPASFSAFWVIVMRTFYKTNVPDSVIESARIDGAGEWRTLFQIVMPLALPGLATVALFASIGIWNNFFLCMLLVDEAKYFNLQYTIYTTLNNIRFLKEMAAQVGALSVPLSELPAETFRMGMAVVTVGPIIMAYPFFQKYFIKGLTIGAVKG
ncbi:MAG: carbohydrate ABC transporter permease [Clostridiales bacterium]|nr:carbohydrate ABC transporter permease [Clostridiales bacterium]